METEQQFEYNLFSLSGRLGYTDQETGSFSRGADCLGTHLEVEFGCIDPD